MFSLLFRLTFAIFIRKKVTPFPSVIAFKVEEGCLHCISHLKCWLCIFWKRKKYRFNFHTFFLFLSFDKSHRKLLVKSQYLDSKCVQNFFKQTLAMSEKEMTFSFNVLDYICCVCVSFLCNCWSYIPSDLKTAWYKIKLEL